MNAIVVIPARGGSKRIPRKNLALIGDWPMISHTIKIAAKSAIFQQIFVSTDDPEIAEVSEASGARVIKRAPKLGTDTTPILPVIQDAIDRTRDLNYDYVCMLLPTAIFLDARIIGEAKGMLEAEENVDYVITVEEYSSPPQRALKLSNGGRIQIQHNEFINSRSQELEVLYFDAGQMSFGTKLAWVEGRHSFNSNTKAICIPKYSSVDIDTPDDLEYARQLFRIRQCQ